VSHGYQPEQTAAKRQLSVRRWNERYKRKEIRWQGGEEKPAPVPNPPPPAPPSN
jgi:hypothetical protein